MLPPIYHSWWFALSQVSSILKSKLVGKPQALFTDVDGVLTTSRDSYVLDLGVVDLLRSLVAAGVPVCIVSGNAYPVVLALQRYLGLSPYFVAESGCVVLVRGDLVTQCRDSVGSIAEEIAREFGLIESPTNAFRLCDRAFILPSKLKESPTRIRELERAIMNRYPGYYALYSGYALHVYPRECSKGTGVRLLARLLSIDLDKSIALGDSVTDVDMVKAVGVGIAVGDADEELKREAVLVLPYSASRSTRYFLVELIRYLDEIRATQSEF